MYTVNPSSDELRLAHLVSKSVALTGVRLIRVDATCNIDPRTFKGKLSTSFECDGEKYLLDDDRKLSTLVNFKVEIKSEDCSVAFSASLLYAVDFLTPPGSVPDEIRDKGFPAFSRLNGPYLCWPYIREEISSLTVRAGLPALVLPTMVIEPITEPIPQDETATDEHSGK